MESHRINRHVTGEVWREIFEGTSTPPPQSYEPNNNLPSNAIDVGTASDPDKNTEEQVPMQIPQRVGAACCAQFAVSRDQVLKRPREDYVKFRDWVTQTDKDNASSGRVMEFLWHIIFGKQAV